MPKSPLTREECERVQAILMADRYQTVKGACIQAGLAKQYGAIKMAVSRFRRGELSDETADNIALIVGAVESQCRGIVADADTLAADGKFTSWQQWWLEKKDPSEYGRVTKTEITGEDGGPIQVSRVKSMDDDELIATMLDTSKAAEGEG